MDNAIELRNDLQRGNGCKFKASITADYGDVSYTFAMQCSANNHGDIAFTVSEPKSISGISGSLDGDGGKLTFDDEILAFNVLADDLITPVGAPWFFLKALRGGYVKACEENEDGIHIIANDTYSDNAFQVDIYTNKDLIPIHSDIFWDGRRIVSIALSNFTIL